MSDNIQTNIKPVSLNNNRSPFRVLSSGKNGIGAFATTIDYAAAKENANDPEIRSTRSSGRPLIELVLVKRL